MLRESERSKTTLLGIFTKGSGLMTLPMVVGRKYGGMAVDTKERL